MQAPTSEGHTCCPWAHEHASNRQRASKGLSIHEDRGKQTGTSVVAAAGCKAGGDVVLSAGAPLTGCAVPSVSAPQRVRFGLRRSAAWPPCMSKNSQPRSRPVIWTTRAMHARLRIDLLLCWLGCSIVLRSSICSGSWLGVLIRPPPCPGPRLPCGAFCPSRLHAPLQFMRATASGNNWVIYHGCIASGQYR